MVNYFNNYFTYIATDLLRSLPVNNSCVYFDKIETNPLTCYLYPTNEIEVSNLILTLSNKTNSLFDIKAKTLILVNDILIPILVYLFNFCIESGVYPDTLKEARVVPIYKNGEIFCVSNYRPISTLRVFNKIFEIILSQRLKDFTTKNHIISCYQFGFRSKSNPTLAIFMLLKDFISTINKKMYTIALFLDLKKAFDLVDRSILLKKLSKLGFRGLTHELLSSYLSNRNQVVAIDQCQSDMLLTVMECPRGPFLDPFYLIFLSMIL